MPATAVDLAIWSGIGLIFVPGHASGRIRQDSPISAIGHGVLLTLIGGGALAIKTLN